MTNGAGVDDGVQWSKNNLNFNELGLPFTVPPWDRYFPKHLYRRYTWLQVQCMSGLELLQHFTTRFNPTSACSRISLRQVVYRCNLISACRREFSGVIGVQKVVRHMCRHLTKMEECRKLNEANRKYIESLLFYAVGDQFPTGIKTNTKDTNPSSASPGKFPVPSPSDAHQTTVSSKQGNLKLVQGNVGTNNNNKQTPAMMIDQQQTNNNTLVEIMTEQQHTNVNEHTQSMTQQPYKNINRHAEIMAQQQQTNINKHTQGMTEQQPAINYKCRTLILTEQQHTNINKNTQVIEQEQTNINRHAEIMTEQEQTNINKHTQGITEQQQTNYNCHAHILTEQQHTHINRHAEIMTQQQRTNINKHTQVMTEQQHTNISKHTQVMTEQEQTNINRHAEIITELQQTINNRHIMTQEQQTSINGHTEMAEQQHTNINRRAEVMTVHYFPATTSLVPTPHNSFLSSNIMNTESNIHREINVGSEGGNIYCPSPQSDLMNATSLPYHHSYGEKTTNVETEPRCNSSVHNGISTNGDQTFGDDHRMDTYTSAQSSRPKMYHAVFGCHGSTVAKKPPTRSRICRGNIVSKATPINRDHQDIPEQSGPENFPVISSVVSGNCGTEVAVPPPSAGSKEHLEFQSGPKNEAPAYLPVSSSIVSGLGNTDITMASLQGITDLCERLQNDTLSTQDLNNFEGTRTFVEEQRAVCTAQGTQWIGDQPAQELSPEPRHVITNAGHSADASPTLRDSNIKWEEPSASMCCIASVTSLAPNTKDCYSDIQRCENIPQSMPPSCSGEISGVTNGCDLDETLAGQQNHLGCHTVVYSSNCRVVRHQCVTPGVTQNQSRNITCNQCVEVTRKQSASSSNVCDIGVASRVACDLNNQCAPQEMTYNQCVMPEVACDQYVGSEVVRDQYAIPEVTCDQRVTSEVVRDQHVMSEVKCNRVTREVTCYYVPEVIRNQCVTSEVMHDQHVASEVKYAQRVTPKVMFTQCVPQEVTYNQCLMPERVTSKEVRDQHVIPEVTDDPRVTPEVKNNQRVTQEVTCDPRVTLEVTSTQYMFFEEDVDDYEPISDDYPSLLATFPFHQAISTPANVAPIVTQGVQVSQSKYGELLAVIEELGKDIRPTYAGSKNASERLKKGIMHARALVRECLIETERCARQ